MRCSNGNQHYRGCKALRQKITATVIALTLGAFAAIGAFASQDKVDLGSAGHFFSSAVLSDATPGAGTPTATDTATAGATDTATAGATDTATPDATTTGTPEATATGTPEATTTAGHDDDASETPEASETPHGNNENNGKHRGDDDNCGQGHDAAGTSTPDTQSTPTPVPDTATPDQGTATIVAQIPVHCHGEHGREHDEGHGDSGNQHNGGPGNSGRDHRDD